MKNPGYMNKNETDDFFDREIEAKLLSTILKSKPNLVYFVYGPINSGKTALLTRVLERLPDEFRVFYINFRRVELSKYEDFVRALFWPRRETILDKVKDKEDIIGATLGWMAGVWKKFNVGFELPVDIIKSFLKQGGMEGGQDVFNYLEKLFKGMREKDLRPVLVLDELQMIKEVRKNGSVLHDLFNFMVGMTKETHIAHCLASTSDCLFIEEIYGNARLEGRSEYVLVDDLDKDRAFEVYKKFGFKNKEQVWNFIGGKFGDMIRLHSKIMLDNDEKSGLELMLRDEINRLENLLEKIQYKLLPEERIFGVRVEEIMEVLAVVSGHTQVPKGKIPPLVRKLLVEENFLFMDPVSGDVRPQGHLIRKAIEHVVSAVRSKSRSGKVTRETD